MGATAANGSPPAVVDLDGLDALVRAVAAAGYTVVGPTRRDGVVAYEEIESAEDLPIGWTDEQEAGAYELRRRDDVKAFGYAVGPHSWKRHLFPPRSRLFAAHREPGGAITIEHDIPAPPQYAFVGVRACEIAAIGVQDRVFLDPAHPDPVYARNRQANIVIAVQCGDPGGTCFCASMGTGPEVTDGYDLRLTELVDPVARTHTIVAEVGTDTGAALLAQVPQRPAGDADLAAAEAVVDDAARSMGRSLDTSNLPGLLRAEADAPEWDDVARRCLTCANCTMVCPTCFCSTVEDSSDLGGVHAERWRTWDSCFSLGFTYLHGGPVRESAASRYRQWITHKLDTWFDQFGESGCVGCGRCITWCPVGIDITAEAGRIGTRTST